MTGQSGGDGRKEEKRERVRKRGGGDGAGWRRWKKGGKERKRGGGRVEDNQKVLIARTAV